VFQIMGDAFNASVGVEETLRLAAESLVKEFGLKGCHFRLLSRDQKILEHVASYGLSQEFLDKGPVDAERSVAEALEGRVVAVSDASSDPRIQYPEAHAKEGIVSLLTVPLSSRGQVIGVMRLSAAEPRRFAPDEVEFFKVAALFCSSAVTHAMFHSILEHVTSTIRSSLDLFQVLDGIVRVVAEDLRARGASIRLLDGMGKYLELRAAYGLSSRYLERASGDPGKGVWQALEGKCVPILDAAHDPLVRHPEEVVRERIASMLFVPLVIRDRAIGVLALYTHRQYRFSEDEIHLMMAIGEQCALAIRNAQMYADIKRRYDSVVDDFQVWFEHYYTHPTT
jgi:GAF domain-containing protein